MAHNNLSKPSNADLNTARAAKKDSFFTMYEDIEKEMAAYVEHNKDVFRNKTVLCPCDDPELSNFTKYFVANFDKLGLKKLISTSYNESAKNSDLSPEQCLPKQNTDKHMNHGKIFVLERGSYDSFCRICGNIPFEYLEGDGDFQSEEVTALLYESDIVITNPPFSYFRKILKWIMDARKQFIILGNINVITCKEVFPLIKENVIWLGATIHSGDRKFYVPDDYPLNASGCGIDEKGRRFIRVKGVRWFTNIDHDDRHTRLKIMTRKDNLKYNKRMRKKLMRDYGLCDYPICDNYKALEVPTTDSIPSDYDGVMAVPITFIDKYCPEQFEIIGTSANGNVPEEIKLPWNKPHNNPFVGGKAIYQRIMIKKKSF